MKRKLIKWVGILSDETQAAVVSLSVACACLVALLLIIKFTGWELLYVLAFLAFGCLAFVYLFLKYATMQKGAMQAQEAQTGGATQEASADEGVEATELHKRTLAYQFLQAVLQDGLRGETTFCKAMPGWSAKQYRAFVEWADGYGILRTEPGKKPFPLMTLEAALVEVADKELETSQIENYWQEVIASLPEKAAGRPYQRYSVEDYVLIPQP